MVHSGDEIVMDRGNLTISVVVPGHNEEQNIRLAMEAMASMFEDSGLKGEVILVDDGSTDGTLAEARSLEAELPFLRVLTYERRRGLSRALEFGLGAATGDILVFYPADLQFSAHDIPRMVDKILEGHDIVTGWKQGRYEKWFVSAIYNFLSKRLFDIPIHDLNSVKAFRRELLEVFEFRSDFHRYMVVMAVQAGYKPGEVKVTLSPRAAGRSKFTGSWRVMVGLLDFIAVWFQYRFASRPLLLFGSLGIFIALSGFILGLVALYMRFVLQSGFRPLLTLTVLLITVGILLFGMGFLGESIQTLSRRLEQDRRDDRRPRSD
jgi:glycosyltransferase involved in cell wall biosynthesis